MENSHGVSGSWNPSWNCPVHGQLTAQFQASSKRSFCLDDQLLQLLLCSGWIRPNRQTWIPKRPFSGYGSRVFSNLHFLSTAERKISQWWYTTKKWNKTFPLASRLINRQTVQKRSFPLGNSALFRANPATESRVKKSEERKRVSLIKTNATDSPT